MMIDIMTKKMMIDILTKKMTITSRKGLPVGFRTNSQRKMKEYSTPKRASSSSECQYNNTDDEDKIMTKKNKKTTTMMINFPLMTNSMSY